MYALIKVHIILVNIGGSGDELHMLGYTWSNDYRYFICFSFPTENQIRITENKGNGWSNGKIYLIKGVK